MKHRTWLACHELHMSKLLLCHYPVPQVEQCSLVQKPPPAQRRNWLFFKTAVETQIWFLHPQPEQCTWQFCNIKGQRIQVCFRHLFTIFGKRGYRGAYAYLSSGANNTYFLFIPAAFSKHAQIQHSTNTIFIIHNYICIVKNVWHLQYEWVEVSEPNHQSSEMKQLLRQ